MNVKHTRVYLCSTKNLTLNCLQTSVDSVEALIKKHTDFEGMSVAHEERTKVLSDQANRLIHAGHYATTRYM